MGKIHPGEHAWGRERIYVRAGEMRINAATGGREGGKIYIRGSEGRHIPPAAPTPPTPTQVKASESGEAFRLRLVISLSLCVFP